MMARSVQILILGIFNTEEKGMAPHELWCNESQERYVLAIDQQSLDLFKKICDRETLSF